MRRRTAFFVPLLCLLVGMLASVALAAYQHAGDAEKDAAYVLQVYPSLKNTKLDNCALCHSGGTVIKNGKTTTYGSCQWCHYKYGYDGSGDIEETLNSYGVAYNNAGRNAAALTTIKDLDSDGDTYSNITEINAIRYPGDAKDDPTDVVAPYRIYTKAQLQAMPQHKQFMLMNTTKSGDYYTEYSGVIMEDFLKNTVGISSTATQITVFSPDGYSQRHPLNDSTDNTGSSYAPYVLGTYPEATYFYNTEADKKITSYGWCNYSSAGNRGRTHGDSIKVDNGLRLLLALQADGTDLIPGELGPDNKLKANSEGPFRVVAPQKLVGPPDQPSTNPTQGTIWQYDANAEHNAGFATKSATIIKVEPLPAGTTDIDVYEAGWQYVDQSKIVVYGALEGPALVSPLNGASTPVNSTTLTWKKYADPDPNATVTYTVEVSPNDQNHWTAVTTQVTSAPKAEKTFFAGAGKFVLFGLIGSIAVGVPRRSRKYLGLILVIAMSGAALSACGDDDHDHDSSSNVSLTVPAGSLQPNTTYFWRVTANGPNSHAVSTVSATSTFNTTP